jgi:copper homeostasis protein CutC
MEPTHEEQAELRAALLGIIDAMPSSTIDELCTALQELECGIHRLLDRSDSVLVEQVRDLYRRGTANVLDGGGDIATARMMLEEMARDWRLSGQPSSPATSANTSCGTDSR